MVNNEFHVVGVAVSNFVDISNGSDFKKYSIEVEVEIIGSRVGKVNKMTIEVYGTNKAINVYGKILGKQVVVNGYIDSFCSNKNGLNYTRLVAQNLMVFDKPVVVNAVSNADVKTPLPTEDTEEIADEDLPF